MNHSQQESKRNDTFSRIPSTFIQQRRFNYDPDQPSHEFRRITSKRGSSTPMYQSFFYGYFFYFTNFGHKVLDCREYVRNVPEHSAYVAPRNIKCYKCYNYGHIAWNWKSVIDPSMKKNINNRYKKIWKRKERKKE